jgi:5'-nucleotidase
MKKHYKILLTNDDGFNSLGLKALYNKLKSNNEVVVVAPIDEQSGIGHAFTLNKPIRYSKLPESCGMNGYSVSGTPADCVKFALSHILKQKPDLVISGMNIGENSGICGYYSGTVAAARESAFWRVPAIAFSLCSGGEKYLNDYCEKALEIFYSIANFIPSTNGKPVFYNVNFPSCSPKEHKGIKVTRQSTAFFDDKYKMVKNEKGETGYIVYGDKIALEDHDLYDSRALLNNYITVSPLYFDATADWVIPIIKDIEKL